MCWWVEHQRDRPSWPFPEVADIVEQSAAAIRARRAALLERADADSPTEGAIALADAHLQAEEWFQRLPDNAAQDAVVLELAGVIEAAISHWIDQRQEERHNGPV